MQRFTIFFIVAIAVHDWGGFSAHHQELKNCTQSIWYVPGLLPATADVVEVECICKLRSGTSITVNTIICRYLCQIKLQGSVFRPRYCHLQDIALHENKLQWPDDLCVSRLIYQSVDYSIIHVAGQYETLKNY
jgi:hypothetical protein